MQVLLLEASQPQSLPALSPGCTVSFPVIKALHEYALWSCVIPFNFPTYVILAANWKGGNPCPLKSMNGKYQVAERTERVELKPVKEKVKHITIPNSSLAYLSSSKWHYFNIRLFVISHNYHKQFKGTWMLYSKRNVFYL